MRVQTYLRGMFRDEGAYLNDVEILGVIPREITEEMNKDLDREVIHGVIKVVTF